MSGPAKQDSSILKAAVRPSLSASAMFAAKLCRSRTAIVGWPDIATDVKWAQRGDARHKAVREASDKKCQHQMARGGRWLHKFCSKFEVPTVSQLAHLTHYSSSLPTTS